MAMVAASVRLLVSACAGGRRRPSFFCGHGSVGGAMTSARRVRLVVTRSLALLRACSVCAGSAGNLGGLNKEVGWSSADE